MLRTIVLTALAVLLTGGVALAQIVELEGRYWFIDLDASVKTKSDGIPGTNIDLSSDLGLQRGEAPEGRLTFWAGPNSRIRLAYAHLEFEADQTLSRTVTFSGTTFTASSRVTSDVDIHYGRIGWIWQPVAIPGLLKFGGLLEAKGFVIDADLRTRGVTPEIKRSAPIALALPTLGMALDVTPLAMLHLFGEVSGLPAGDLGHIVDAEVGVRFVPIRFFSLVAGYRLFDVRADEGGDSAKLRLNGPFVGASLRF
jgi:hypothetical protein